MKLISDFINKTFCDDNMKIMQEIPDKSVDLLLTDPPYGENIGDMSFVTNLTGGVAKRTDYSTHNTKWDKQSITKEQIDECFRVSKNQIFFGANFFANLLPNSRCWIVWDKRTHEKYNNDFADCEFAWTSFNRSSRIIRWLWSGMLQGNMKCKEKRYHPTQKSIVVIRKMIEMFTNENEIVLDPFFGSGTTLVACKELKRRYIGIEIIPEYYEIVKKRLNEVDPLFNIGG